MAFAVLSALLFLGGATLALVDHLPPALVPWVVVPALLWIPGQGFARAFHRDPLRRAIGGFGWSALVSALSVCVGRWTGLEGAGVLASVVTLTVTGHCLRAVPADPPKGWWRKARWTLLLLVPLAASWQQTVQRPLDAYWWDAHAEEDWEGNLPDAGTGWLQNQARPEGGRWLKPRRADPVLMGPFDGTLLVLLRGPVGASMKLKEQTIRIERNVTVDLLEGPVARYMDRGVVALPWTRHLDAGEVLPLWLSDPHQSEIYLLPTAESLWGLHASGELRFVHYYQLLNMVEQLRWSRELLGRRTVTDVQPPGWSYILAGPLSIGPADVPVANVTLLLYLGLGILTGLSYLRAWGHRVGGPAILLPAAIAAMHCKLMLEPGSGMLPDSLYSIAAVGALASLSEGGFAGGMLVTQLLRYPGSLLCGLGALMDGQFRAALRGLALVLLVAIGFGIYGVASEQLSDWLQTVWWETGPEHWHGETRPSLLLGRLPEFYGLWLKYSGGTPLLAALALFLNRRNRGSLPWRGAWVALSTSALYSLLLCSIDHFPSHYFLPLIWLPGLSLGCSASAPSPILRYLLPLLALMGLWISYTSVPIV